MRHGKGLKKLNRTSSHRQAMLMNLAMSVLKYEQVTTTLSKAKVVRPFVENLITIAKQNDINTIRTLSSRLTDKAVIDKLLKDIGPRFANRQGGYTRIYKAGFRYGDNAPKAIIELVALNKEAMEASRKTAQKEVADKNKAQQGTDSAVQEKITQSKPKLSKAPRLASKAAPTQKSISRKPTINKSLKGGGS